MKLILSLVFTCMVSMVNAQSDPGAAFREYLQSKYPACYTPDGSGGWVFVPGCTAMTQEDSLDFAGLFPHTGGYIELVDLQYFTSLKYLNGSNNYIVSIQAFPPSLEKLIMQGVYFDSPAAGTAYPTLPSTLQYLDCSGSFKLSLEALPASLRFLNCAGNKLSSLPSLPAQLDTLICNNQVNYEQNGPNLTSLPALPSSLKFLNCSNNSLSSLPVLPSSLKYLDCAHQRVRLSPESWHFTLTSVPSLPASLEYLNCSLNKLNNLPFLPATLKYLYCNGSRYFEEPFNYTGNNEGISVLPQLPEGLLELNVSNSNIDCLPHLPASLTKITLDRTRITCLPTAGTYSVLPPGPAIPVCSIIYNPSQCVSAAKISGEVFFDYNSNGIKDPAETFCSNIAVQLSGGIETFTNNSGHFEFFTLIGNHTLTVTAPTYFNVNPGSINYTFSSYDTSVTALIALQPNVNIDSAVINLIPSVARPGFDHSLVVSFNNVGTTITDVNVVVTYDASKLTYVNSTDPNVVPNGNQLNLHVSNLYPQTPKSFIANFEVLPSVPLNDTIFSYAVIYANTNTASDSSITVVQGSYDPNDKTATPVLSPVQVANGTFINYLVRFQNTGTDTAFNVVVTDTLDAQLDASTFEINDVSHSVKTTRDGNKLSFEFIDILLPDSNINEPLSHGYIKFRVKPVLSVVDGAVIPNKAAIYFDYNAPVITNTANTIIAAAGTIPVRIISFNATRRNEDGVRLSWITENEINISHYEIQKSTDARSFAFVNRLNAYGGNSNSYSFDTEMRNDIEFYRLKITEHSGQVEYSTVVPVRKGKKNEKIFLSNNPVQQHLYFTADVELSGKPAVLVNSAGQVVLTTRITGGSQMLNITNLTPGIYYLRVETEVKRIVVK